MSDNFKMYVPIEKIDVEKRTVGGWATTEEIDKQSEVVDYAGSKEAFQNWQGNIREMHEPKAVGKAIEILPNDEQKKIYVKAFISKGANDTWEKIKEGILNGFSIGGRTVHKTQQVIKDVENNTTRTVSRIMKYKLNELSLVDNPANATCSFALVKSVDGIPYQTEIVEDFKKLLVTEATDPLKQEVKEHRDKADSLVKKTLTTEELEKLSDDDFGLIRKSIKNDTVTKERFIPMPDKVHAVRALEVLGNYNLSKSERDSILSKAKNILGAAYENHYERLQKEEDKQMSNELKQILEKFASLETKISEMEKSYEGAYKPIAGAKETPKKSDSDPNLGESKPLQAGAADDVETQHEEGSYPYKSNEPEKFEDDPTSDIWKAGVGAALRAAGRAAAPHVREAGRAVAAAAPKVGEAAGKVGRKVRAAIQAARTAKSEDGFDETSYILDTANDIGKMSDEEYDVLVKSLDEADAQELERVLYVLGKAEQFVLDAAGIEKEEQGYDAQGYPKHVKKDGDDSRGDKYPGKHPSTTDTQTQDPAGAYPAKGPVKAEKAYNNNENDEDEDDKENAKDKDNDEEDSEKVAGQDNDLAKVLNGFNSLRKRLDGLESQMRQPKPRKYKVEKTNVDNSDNNSDELDAEIAEVTKWNESGKPLTSEQIRKKEQVLDKMFTKKFGKNL